MPNEPVGDLEGSPSSLSNLHAQEVDMRDVHNESISLLEGFEAANTESGLAVAAMILSIGRLMSPHQPMEIEDEVRYVQTLVSYLSAYFAGGGVN